MCTLFKVRVFALYTNSSICAPHILLFWIFNPARRDVELEVAQIKMLSVSLGESGMDWERVKGNVVLDGWVED